MGNHLEKKINGKTFKWVSREFNRSFAEKKAEEYRKKGYYARVISDSTSKRGNYHVYICKK